MFSLRDIGQNRSGVNKRFETLLTEVNKRFDIIWGNQTKVHDFCLNFEKIGSLGEHNAMQNDRLKPVRIPLSAVKLLDMISRLLQA